MSNVHVYRADKQPATRYVDNILAAHPILFKIGPHRRLWAQCCNQLRIAGNCTVQVYYDATYFWCADGKGCKGKREIEAKRNKEFRNRSRASKLAWINRRAKPEPLIEGPSL